MRRTRHLAVDPDVRRERALAGGAFEQGRSAGGRGAQARGDSRGIAVQVDHGVVVALCHAADRVGADRRHLPDAAQQVELLRRVGVAGRREVEPRFAGDRAASLALTHGVDASAAPAAPGTCMERSEPTTISLIEMPPGASIVIEPSGALQC